MTVREALQAASSRFHDRGIETPYLDAVVLLCASTGREKAALFASFMEPLAAEAEETFQDAVDRRLGGLPVSYILKRKEFFGLVFYVDERVLVPRPDTETLVETAIDVVKANPEVRRIHDACTGSGCIPIALAEVLKDIPGIEFSASDLSEDALEVFRVNSLHLLGRVLPHQKSDLLASVPGPFDMITANPPYITREEATAMKASGWPEPLLALDGGEEGMDFISRLAAEAVERLDENGYLLIEGTDSQAELIAETFKASGFQDLKTVRDLAGRRRVTVGRKGKRTQ